MELATEVWGDFVTQLSVSGLLINRSTCLWKVERPSVVGKLVDGDELDFFVSKSTRPSSRRAPGNVAARLSKIIVP